MQTTTANKKNSPTSRSSILSPNTRNSIQNKDGSNTTTNTTPNESALLPSGQQEQPLLRREANTHETFSHGSNPPVATTTTTTATRKRTPRYSISIKELLN
ncbi:hypothetical protein FDP41_011680 [Naegleria fowleri]|nr:uncharacterized protein FDP41_011680 [Naegleria fowleri]KAF0982225.1 hypothetical protein FDP41_011680 [Naegleria fowleri]